MTVSEKMMLILSVDPKACLRFSTYTQQWYVESRLEIGDGVMLRGISEHHDDPNLAVQAFFVQITTTQLDEYLVSRYHDERREYVWNGAAFRECTRDRTGA